MYYKIGERIEPFEPKTFDNIPFQYVAVIGSEEWINSNRKFNMGIEWDINLDELVRDLTVCEINVYMDGALYDGTSEIADGSHVLRVEAIDELGHKSFKEVTFVLDTKGPNIIISNVEDGFLRSIKHLITFTPT